MNEKAEVVVRLPMACRCGKERAAEWDARRAAVFEGEYEKNFVTLMVHELTHNYRDHTFNIDHVYADQWLGLTVKGANYKTHEPITIHLQCDTVEDGLVAVWEYLNEHYAREEEEDGEG